MVTGGAGGIGRESAILFAEQGANVTVVDMNEAEGLETVRRIEEKLGKGVAIFQKCNVSKAAEVKHVVERTEKEFGKLNVIFNNAGKGSTLHAWPLTSSHSPLSPFH